MIIEKLQDAKQDSLMFLTYILAIAGVLLSVLPIDLGECGWIHVISGIVIIEMVVFVGAYSRVNNKYKYINTQIELAEVATKSILIVMKSLSDENVKGKELCKQLDEVLELKTKEKLDVRVICPFQYDGTRLEGATQLHRRGIKVRYVETLSNNDCRYILVDDKIIAFSQDKNNCERLSRKYVKIESQNLARILKNDFDSLWSDGVKYQKYIESFDEIYD